MRRHKRYPFPWLCAPPRWDSHRQKTCAPCLSVSAGFPIIQIAWSSPVNFLVGQATLLKHRGTEEAEEDGILFSNPGVSEEPYPYKILKVLKRSTESLSCS